MKRVQVSSSNLASVGYEKETSTLEVELKSGSVYRYISVPLRHFEGLLSAGSTGRYFNQYIKDRYRFKQMR